jgi:hypothetical protein
MRQPPAVLTLPSHLSIYTFASHYLSLCHRSGDEIDTGTRTSVSSAFNGGKLPEAAADAVLQSCL